MNARARNGVVILAVLVTVATLLLGTALAPATTHGSVAGSRSAPAASGVRAAPAVHPAATASAPSTPSSPSTQPTAPGPAAEAKLQAAIQAAHLDPRTVYPPNLLYAPKMQNGMIVHPAYPQAPEPVGLADYGIDNSTGVPSSYTIDTTSYQASVSLNSVDPYYLSNGVPQGFTSQLNVVLRNVTLFGNSSYTFWAQNVFNYDAYSQQLQIQNNIWNFSAPPPAPQPVNTFYYGVPGYTNGTDNPGVGFYYVQYAPIPDVPTPFTLTFFLNSTKLVVGSTAFTELDFGVRVLTTTYLPINYTFDRVLFNNTGGGLTIPQAQFHVDGTNITPTQFIPYDAEVMIGGPGGGSTATFNSIDGTMTLQHWDARSHSYVNEPAAWSAGSETGETSVGVAEYYTADDVVHLGPGPEFIQPFWNSSASAAPGAARITGTVTPSNSWAFATWGSSYRPTLSAWAPLPQSGAYSWNLTQGTYSVKLMESDHTPITRNAIAVTGGSFVTENFALALNLTLGVYTPLYATSNAQLAAISSGGAGTLASPYLLYNNEFGALAPEFATFNDYAFLSYAGISLTGTTAYVEIANTPPFTVNYWGMDYNFTVRYDVPSWNDLPIWLFDTSHVSILGGTLEGWFSSNQQGFPYANIVIWNSTSTLVSGVTFDVVSNAIFTYGGTGNTFSGNIFLNGELNGQFMGATGYFYLGYPYYVIGYIDIGATGIDENEFGDAIWNNYFDVATTAFEANVNVYDDFYPSFPQVFVNSWNLSARISASTVTFVNGIPLSGSVAGNASVCGNWWWNYYTGGPVPYSNPYPPDVPAYTGTGNIISGGDYCPLGPHTFTVPVTESGLPSGTSWEAQVVPVIAQTLPYGGTYQTTGTVIDFTLPSGIYLVAWQPLANESVTPALEYFAVEPNGDIYNGTAIVTSLPAVYAPIPGTLVFAESGLPSGTAWSVSLTGQPLLHGTGPTLPTSVPYGSYSYTVVVPTGYFASPSSGNVNVVAGGFTEVTIVFTPTAPTAGALSGTVTPATATVWVDGTMVPVSVGAFQSTLAPGVHMVEATATDYYPYFNNVTVTSGVTTTVTIALNPVTPSPGPDGTLSLTVTPGAANLWVDGVPASLTGGGYSAPEAPGVHSVEATATGYYAYFNNVTVTSSQNSAVHVVLNAVASTTNTTTTTTSSSSGLTALDWALIALLVVVAVGALVAIVLLLRRRPGSPESAPAETGPEAYPEEAPAAYDEGPPASGPSTDDSYHIYGEEPGSGR